MREYLARITMKGVNQAPEDDIDQIGNALLQLGSVERVEVESVDAKPNEISFRSVNDIRMSLTHVDELHPENAKVHDEFPTDQS